MSRKKRESKREAKARIVAQRSRDAGETMKQLEATGALLHGHKGFDFYHRAWSEKARKKKQARRRAVRASRRRNRARKR